MRILHLTDTHLRHARVLIGGPPGWSRADDHHDAFVRALAPVLRDEVDLVVHSGDVFDRSRPPATDVERALAVLGEVSRRVPVVVIAGNHDRRGLAHHPAPPGVTLVDAPRRIDHGGAWLGFVPYQRTAEAFRAAVDGLGTLDLLICHQAFDGVTIPRPRGRSFVFRVGRRDDTVGPDDIRRVSAVACGHIHPRQVVRYGPCAVVHPGSTERTAFAERDQTKGYALWQLGPRPTWRFVDLPTRPMRVVECPADLAEIDVGDQVWVRRREWLGPSLSRGARVVPPRSAHRRQQLPLFPRAR